MGVEIEHKFLVNPALLPLRQWGSGQLLEQGYLATDPAVRVRVMTDRAARRAQAFLTIKGKGLRVRAEFEYAIPPADARKLLTLCGDYKIRKIRRRWKGWEVDEFLGRHKGLWMAEYELPSARAKLPPAPPWLGREVTSDPRFSNVKLSAATLDAKALAELCAP